MPIRNGVYYLSKRSVAKVQTTARIKDVIPEVNTDPPIGLIQGQKPDSVEEWRIAIALNKLRMKYTYQYEVRGGRRLRGGQIVDFMVFTAPVPTPVYVNGEYWHAAKTANEDRLKQLHVVQDLYGQCFEPLILWTKDILDVESARQLLLQKLRYK